VSEIGIGFHEGIDFATYAAIPALNASKLCKAFTKGGQISMKRLHAAVEGRIKVDDSDDMRMGRAIHCRLLEPERYSTDFLVSGSFTTEPTGSAERISSRTATSRRTTSARKSPHASNGARRNCTHRQSCGGSLARGGRKSRPSGNTGGNS
jgi:hypothetical protein